VTPAVVSGSWRWAPSLNEPVEVLSGRQLWGRDLMQVVIPSTQRCVQVPVDELLELDQRRWQVDEVVWRAAATRALSLSADGEPVVAARDLVSLLPHQLATLERAMAMDPLRLAVCDEVGLGKTITAGAILSEMKALGRSLRVVVVAPKGVQLQWVAEMSQHFGEEFVRVGPEGVPVDAGVNPWRAFDQVVCSVDAVKPLRRRTGWTDEQISSHNAARFRAIIDAGWDLVIIDEAHHVAGSSEDVARHQLAVELAAAAPHLLLLTATPHSGKSDGFRRLLSLIDDSFSEGREVTRGTVAPHVARTDKRSAVGHHGEPLFKPRVTELRVVPYGDRLVERELYFAVTDYVRHGWDAARRDGRSAAAFLVLLMQRLVSSSTAAILAALERRSAALGEPGQQLALFATVDEWESLDGQEQFEILSRYRGPAWESERAELHQLLNLARDAHASGTDAKTRAFLDLMNELRRSEGNPNVKILVFTEFVPTQEMLLEVLDAAGVPAVAINGSMGLSERAVAQDAFRDDAQVLVSTDAGGEGINLQFAHVVVNWDLPWSPSRLEQRIGRVDRIGQNSTVRAYNFACENSVEARVLEVLDEKLETILAEFGADKRSDVLESADRHVDALWTAAVVAPERLRDGLAAFEASTKADVDAATHIDDLIDPSGPPSRAVNPERMASIMAAASAARARLGFDHDDPLDALDGLPEVAPGEPCPTISVARGVDGWLVIWEVTPDGRDRNAIAVFHPDQGISRPDLALAAWEECVRSPAIIGHETPTHDTWQRIVVDGVDHAYQAVARIAGPDGLSLPSAQLRLLVRVRP